MPNRGGDQQDTPGIELGQPGHDDGGEADAARNARGQRLVRARRLDHAGDPRDGAAEEHGAQHNPFDVHTRIRGRRLAFPDHADLISLLGVCHVNEHQHHQHQRDDPTDMYAEDPVERRVV